MDDDDMPDLEPAGGPGSSSSGRGVPFRGGRSAQAGDDDINIPDLD